MISAEIRFKNSFEEDFSVENSIIFLKGLCPECKINARKGIFLINLNQDISLNSSGSSCLGRVIKAGLYYM